VNLSEERDTQGEETQGQARDREVSRSTATGLLRKSSRGWGSGGAELDGSVDDGQARER
jgi:hypothetical protein